MENNRVKVYGYIRVSTEGQVKQGYSLAEQQAEIQKYCKEQGYSLVGIFKDEGISGAKANEDEMSSTYCRVANRRRLASRRRLL